ncbi:DUF4388 domain-containing protein [Geoalkalibacter halelectricus]|uniref:DUF4388 domain-containing protein n=1 Tax=Geoalkalibacter halelectricus TaxID=2847045 RepID=A0ABY5ZPY7_9BACT|nr:DUF4388 domain-containing protein [Geoalkalibacter halelectricus]MDO3377018.1 DUF4388 domain-containing protein [Geoalkalibacter halelectricus]UWZ81240.1 DUF4388 domain-containing protein [Geoalkalibacter halelectricus]
MILLPRGNPLKENLNPGRVDLPGALRKLQAGNFTGYLRFAAETGTGILIFEKGKLVSALFEGVAARLVAHEAVARIFEESLQGTASLDIYQLSPELALSIHALLHGEVLYRGQELNLIDIKALLGRIREKRMNGCLRIYAGERIALIFYDQGHALGFFHDGSTDIETTADTSMSIARLPGAKIDLLSTSSLEDLMLTDLQASADLDALWKKARKVVQERQRHRDAEEGQAQEDLAAQRRARLLTALREIGARHLGKIGASLTEKEFERNVSTASYITEASLVNFYVNLTRAARLVAGNTSVNRMLDEMKNAVKFLLQ